MNKPKRNKKTQIKIAHDALVDLPPPSIIKGIKKQKQKNDGF